MFSEIVHEDVKMSSDGESDPASSSDDVQSPVKVRMRNKKISTEVHTHTHTVSLLAEMLGYSPVFKEHSLFVFCKALRTF